MKSIKIEIILEKDENKLIVDKGSQFIIVSDISDDKIKQLEKVITEILK